MIRYYSMSTNICTISHRIVEIAVTVMRGEWSRVDRWQRWRRHGSAISLLASKAVSILQELKDATTARTRVPLDLVLRNRCNHLACLASFAVKVFEDLGATVTLHGEIVEKNIV